MRTRLGTIIVFLLAAVLAGCASSASAVVSTATLSAPTATLPPPTATPKPAGTIAGSLQFPSSFVPALSIYAISETAGTLNPGVNFHVDTVENQTTYNLTGVMPGTYFVVAYPVSGGPSGFAGGYSEFVTCGLAASCPSHALIPVTVTNGTTTPAINPNDWYADDSAFPPRPS